MPGETPHSAHPPSTHPELMHFTGRSSSPKELRRDSKMLETYFADIEFFLSEGSPAEALRLALDVPHICVALADPSLSSSCEPYVQWCVRWVGSDPECVSGCPGGGGSFADWYRQSRSGEAHTVPVQALRRLQLCRLARAPARCSAMLIEPESPEDAASHRISLALVSAGRRWYAESGWVDPTVQANLARLALFR